MLGSSLTNNLTPAEKFFLSVFMLVFIKGHSHVVLESARPSGMCSGSFNPRESWLKQLLQSHPRSLPKPKEDDTWLNLTNVLGTLAIGAVATFMSNK